MSGKVKALGIVVLLIALLVSTATAVMAQEEGYVFGLVFVDADMDGVWDPGEVGYPGELTVVKVSEDEWAERYVGTPVTLTSPGNDVVTLESAGHRALDEDEDDLCSYHDFALEEDPTGKDTKINPSPLRPCSGTWGLIPAGQAITWSVFVTAPEGYVVTSANPQKYTTGSEAPPLDFGIAPVGAGGVPIAVAQTAGAAPTTLPVAGAAAFSLTSLAILLVGVFSLLAGFRIRK